MTGCLPARGTFQTKLFLAAIVDGGDRAGRRRRCCSRRRCAAEIDARIEQTLVAEARLAAELLARRSAVDGRWRTSTPRPTASAQLLGARVTFIAADGRVVGDSSETLEALATMENHAHAARSGRGADATGSGDAPRYSDTLKIDMLYVAVPVQHPAIAFVRVALPLTDIRQQLQPIADGDAHGARPRARRRGASLAWISRRASAGACARIAGRRGALPRAAI